MLQVCVFDFEITTLGSLVKSLQRVKMFHRIFANQLYLFGL